MCSIEIILHPKNDRWTCFPVYIVIQTRNRLNSAQSSKLQALRKVLEEKQRATTSKKQVQSHENHVTPPAESCEITTHPRFKGDSPPAPDTPSHTPSGSISGSSRKRRAAFEARTRQLLEAEGEEFRKQREGERGGRRSIRKLDFSVTTPQTTTATPKTTPTGDSTTLFLPADMIEEGKKLLTVPEADTQWFITSSEEPSEIEQVLGKGEWETGDHAHILGIGGDFFYEVMSSVEKSVGSAGGRRRERKRVRFSPDAIILSAALEGDLPTLRDCVEKVKPSAVKNCFRFVRQVSTHFTFT